MIEFLVLPIYAASGVLFLMMAGGLVYFVFKLFTGDYSSTTKTTGNGQGSYNSSQNSTAKTIDNGQGSNNSSQVSIIKTIDND